MTCEGTDLWVEEVNALKRDAVRRILELTAAIEWKTLQGKNTDEMCEEREWFRHLLRVLRNIPGTKGA